MVSMRCQHELHEHDELGFRALPLGKNSAQSEQDIKVCCASVYALTQYVIYCSNQWIFGITKLAGSWTVIWRVLEVVQELVGGHDFSSATCEAGCRIDSPSGIGP